MIDMNLLSGKKATQQIPIEENELIKTWQEGTLLTGVAIHNDFKAAFYRPDWPSGYKYRGIVADRDDPGPPKIVTSMYESDDLINWVKYGIVFNIGGQTYSFVHGIMWDADINKFVATYVGPHGGGDEKVGICTSDDLTSFTDQGLQISPGVSPSRPETDRLFASDIVKHNGHYYIPVAEYDQPAGENYYTVAGVALYKSGLNDYTTWTRLGFLIEPDPGIEWEEDRVSETSLKFHDGLWLLYYQGGNVDDLKREIGIAYSSDIENLPFTKYSENPVLFDSTTVNRFLTSVNFIGDPQLFQDENNNWHLFYRAAMDESGTALWHAKITST